MTIPENQLDIWANPGSQAKYKDAHESIRKAIAAYSWPSGKPNYEIYLQGSYKNSTTTRSNSDVDVVIQLNSTFREDLSKLSQPEKDAYNKDHSNATYLWDNFRSDIFSALNNKNGFTVNQGNKCIKVKTPYLDADVVVCMQYRLYEKYSNSVHEKYIEGMTFKSNEGWVVNYPKQHDKNGTLKSNNTNGNYYSAIRIFKNIKSKLIDNNLIGKSEAPSYFIECLLYNIPNSKFESCYGNTVYNVLSYLNQSDISNFKCQNGVTDLFGDSSDQWSTGKAQKFINSAIKFWNDWK
ncbi:Nucleotidyltransferase domain-containing protein [Methanolobus vulcani]|uniref:Nucleotidyltransferase domain-containing protein n=1 Tax=Methanolobus vulcani TaxID=38026 RepID=A0A7Z7AVI9_9EURY|nr:nucleotidyltransferase [Methanolobus vulcani]SDF29996.1 Nucleotidyltransferase domain-containing protein [Methanolobus vulcani]